MNPVQKLIAELWEEIEQIEQSDEPDLLVEQMTEVELIELQIGWLETAIREMEYSDQAPQT